jgi:hypothetical protein
VEEYAKMKRPVSLDQEQLLVNAAQNEGNPRTLGFVIKQLAEIKEREVRLQDQLVAFGVIKVPVALPAGGVARIAGDIGNIFQAKPRNTMAGYSGTAFASMTPAASGEPSVVAAGRMGTMSGRMDVSTTSQSQTCAVCRRICFLSMVTIDQDKLNSAADGVGAAGTAESPPPRGTKIQCIQCTVDGEPEAVAWKSKPNGANALTLGIRYSIDDLQKILEHAMKRAAASPHR